ncbi:hypothetical protein [Streptomyces fulvoviolaceus]|uniref:hypothetical protein n=1 Tax=Streptomyces fulvoviolaceus TaxID=285535 RepID=UPI0021C1EB70|nr:hypothetical protein [Streptomyces fulvoviolaceus]MCT9075266.1 hypothetical protein [Streptomyces fulvoviolaceus]
MNNLAAIPVAAVLLHALAVVEFPGFLELDEDFVIAHPPHLPQDKALDSEHVIINTPWGADVSGPAHQYTGGLYAVAYEGYDGSDYCDIERVYEAQPGGDLMVHAAACAKAVADWFASRQTTAEASGDESGADDTDEVRTSTTEVC